MERALSVLTLILLFISIVIIPIPGKAQNVIGDTGIYLKASFPTTALNWSGPVFLPVTLTDDGILRIYINRSVITWPLIRISFIFPQNTSAPSTGGVFLPIGYNNTFSPTSPDYFNSAVIDLTKKTNWSDTPSRSLYIEPKIYRNGSLVDITLIAIKINKTLLDLSNATFIQNVYLGERSPRFQVNLYGKKLYVKIFNAAEWDARVSSNTLTYIKVEDSDVFIDVNPPRIKYNDNVTITVSLERFFEKVRNIVGLSLDINVTEDNKTLFYMINYYNASEKYLLVNITAGSNTTGGPFISSESYKVNSSTFKYYGYYLIDYAPSTEDFETMYLAAFYTFNIYFTYSNDTVDITLNVTSGDRGNPGVQYIRSPFLQVLSSLDIVPIDMVGTIDINPGDQISFIAHNVPYEYLDVIHYVVSLNLSNYFALDTFAYINYNPDGTIDGIVDLPELPYGGLTYTVFLVFDNNKYIMDGMLRIVPYIITYVLTNSSAYAIDAGNYYIGVFVEGTQSAPGDYIVVEGHGFNLTNLTNFKVNVLGTNVVILDISSHLDPSTGRVTLLAKLLNESSGAPINTGSGLLIVGEQGTPNTANVTFTVVTGAPFKKVLFNPVWEANATSFYINHTKLGDPYLYFEVKYPLVNDTFTTTTWNYSTTMEVIGWDTTTFTLKFYNTFFNISYNWLTLDLTNGYNFTSLYGREIPFLAYGNYTLLEETLTSVNNRTVFTVYMGIDIDVSPCRDGTFNVTIIGAAPNTEYNLTFTYKIYDLVYHTETLVDPLDPEWFGYFTVSVVTDIYGKGSTSLLLRDIYNRTKVVNLTWDVIVYQQLNGTGSLNLKFKWNGTLYNIVDNSTISSYNYSYKESYYETYFYVNATYNVTITTVSYGVIPRGYFLISVPETVLPGDDIVVQIFPHKDYVWDLIIDPSIMYERNELIGWKLYVRLVDPLSNRIVDKVGGYNIGIMMEDLDKDNKTEVWFVVSLKAPFILGEDKTYRVDVQMFLAVLSPSTNMTGYDVTDYGCTVVVDINGTIYWNGYSTNIMLGGDHQIVTVLGVLEAKLDAIKNDTVILKANISDLSRYIKVNITDLLNTINATVFEIKNDMIIIKKNLSTIIMNISTIYDIVKDINGTITILGKDLRRNLSIVISNIESINNTLKNYLVWIANNVSDLATLINKTFNKLGEVEANITTYISNKTSYLEGVIYDVQRNITTNITIEINELNSTLFTLINDSVSKILTKIGNVLNELGEVETNITAYISNRTGYLVSIIHNARDDVITNITMKIENVNNSLYTLLINIRDLVNKTFSKLDQVKSEITEYIDAKTYYLEGIIYDTSDDVIANISLKLDTVYSNLYNLINLRADELKLMINDSTLTILAAVNDTKVTIINKLNNLEISINKSFAVINASLISIKTDLSNIMSQLSNLSNKVDNVKIELINVINTTVTNAKNEVVTLLLNINDTVRVLLTGAINDINKALDDMKSYMENQFNTMTTTMTDALNNMKSTLTNMSNTLINTVTSKLDDMKSTMSDKIDTATSTLVTKIDTLDRRQTDSFSSLNGSLTLFSSIVLLLEVIIIALVGYGLVRRPIG